MDARAAHAAIRFGLGPALGDDVADPAAWLASQLAAPDAGPPGAGVAEAFAALAQDRTDPLPAGQPNRARLIFRAEVAALSDQAVATATPFRERLVWFWANHFTVSLRRGEVAPLAGAYVREAIRPHVAGQFGDMLLAVVRHPAMLLYLDNAGSVGPSSAAGQRQRRGLNENLARECLELHTVSPASGYTQADVTALARVLTGWGVEREPASAGYRFRANAHEPGEHAVLGHAVPPGEEGGVAALRFLATHPATHRHLATKLVRHFVADAPPPDAVRTVEAALRDTGGNLGAAALAVTALPGAWAPLTKLRTPQELVVAAVRAAGLPAGKRPDVPGVLAGLGQGLFNAPFPTGWPDTAADWSGPEALLRRVDWAYGFAGRAGLPEPMEMAEAALGPLLRPDTAAALRGAGSRRDALTLLLASPEFQRR